MKLILFYIYIAIAVLCIAKRGGGSGKPDRTSCTVDGNECAESETCMIKEGNDTGFCFIACTNDDECGDRESCLIKDTEESGVCKRQKKQKHNQCETDAECTDDGESCIFNEDGTKGRCGTSCTSDADCPADEECAEDFGVCKRSRPDFCDSNDECDEGFVCELFAEDRRALKKDKAGKCVESEPEFRRILGQGCSTNEECQEGESCILKAGKTQGRCGVICTSNGDECGEGETCRIKGDENEGVCKPEPVTCTADIECAEDETCRMEGETGVCKRAKKERPASFSLCETDTDCDTGLVCKQFSMEDRRVLKKGGKPKPDAVGKCVEPERRSLKREEREKCTSDDDCTVEGETCNFKNDDDTEGCCRAPPTVCTNDEQCEEGQGCNDGVCRRAKKNRPVLCDVDADCEEGFVCQLFPESEDRRLLRKRPEAAGKCVEAEERRILKPAGSVACSDNSECNEEAGEVCSTKGYCRVPPTVCTEGGEECAEGEVCKIKGEQTEGVCKRQKPEPVTCTANGNECDEGEFCKIKDEQNGVCRREKPEPVSCTVDGECDEGEFCKIKDEQSEGVCKRTKKEKPAFCEGNEDCEEGLECELFTEDRRFLKGEKRPEAAGKCVEPDARRILKKGGKGKRAKCSATSECKDGETCIMPEGKERGFCGVVCSSNEECSESETCRMKDDESEGVCKRERPAPCDANDDCEDGMICELRAELGDRRFLGDGAKPAGKCVEPSFRIVRRKM